ncbi:MAG: imelysin family protein [Flavobacteriales bacterium]
MVKRSNIISVLCLGLIALTLVQCNDKPNGGDEVKFDKAAMLKNIGENIIIPAYADLKVSVDSVEFYNNLFIANPSLTTLSNLQKAFKKAYEDFQYVSVFEFGPAETQLFRANCNTFPCDSAEINTKIAAANFDFSTVADLDAKGFPALDFLLYGKLNNNDSTLAKFTSGANTAKRKDYLTALISDLKTKTHAVNTGWSASGGNYIATFISSTGTDVGSSLGLLVNQLNYDFEMLKNYKLGIPLGKKSLGTVLPEKVEAYYSQISSSLLVKHIKGIENVYLGKSKQGVDGLGLDDYLATLKSSYNGGLLSDAIKTQLTAAISKLQLVPDPLSETVISNASVADAAYIELQKQVVLFKTDMPSALGILITYQDNDGD